MAWVLRPDTEQAASAAVDEARQAHLERGIGSDGGWTLLPETRTAVKATPTDDAIWQAGGALVQAVKNRGPEMLAAPGHLADKVRETISGIPGAVSGAIDRLTDTTKPLDLAPKMSTALPLMLPGGGTVLTRLATIAGTNVLENPAPTPTANAKTAATSVFGDPTGDKPLLDKILSVAMSPAGAEAIIPGLGFLRRAGILGTGGKSAISEGQAQNLVSGPFEKVSHALARTVEGNKAAVSPLTKGGTTAAAIQETALGESGKRAMGDVMERGMLDTTLAAQGQGVKSPALEMAWRRLPGGSNEIAARLKASLAPNPNGEFTVSQAERLLAELGEAAFKGEAASPIARGISGLELRRLYEQAVKQTEGSLPGAAGSVFKATRDEFKGGNALLEMLREHSAFQGLPNRIFANTRAMQDYMSINRAELRKKLGEEGFDALSSALNRGGQVGTRDIPMPGAATVGSAVGNVARGGNTGSLNLLRMGPATALPNMGAQYTGQAPYTLPPQLQSILDVVLQKSGGAALTGERP